MFGAGGKFVFGDEQVEETLLKRMVVEHLQLMPEKAFLGFTPKQIYDQIKLLTQLGGQPRNRGAAGLGEMVTVRLFS